MIVSEEDLLSVGKSFDVNCIKVKTHSFNELIVIDVDTIEDFFKYVEPLKEEVAFYVYTFNEREDYIIPLELFDYNEEQIQKKVDEHNEIVAGIDFNLPKALYVYILKDGMPIITEFISDPVKDIGLKSADEALKLIEEDFYREDVTNAESKLEELSQYILENATDIDMKNTDLRYDYLTSLIAVGGKFEGYDRYFDRFFGNSRRGSAKNFMDRLKSEYDELKKK